MNTKEIALIESFLNSVNSKFPSIKFRCEFNPISNTYIIEVKPLTEFDNNEEYSELEYDFTRNFEEQFPKAMLLFISDNSLNKITNAFFTVGYEIKFLLENNTSNVFVSELNDWSNFDFFEIAIAA